MRVLAIALACFACTGHGRRVRTASQGPTNQVAPSGQVGESNRQRSLASLLLRRGGMSSFVDVGSNYDYDDMDTGYGRRGGYGRRNEYGRRGSSWLDDVRGGYGESGYGRRGYYGSRANSDGYGYRDGYSRRGYSGSYGYSDGYARRGHSWFDGVRGGHGGGYGRRGYSEYDDIRGYGNRGWRSRFGRGFYEDGYDRIGEREYFEDELIKK
mmetsp:Transcript_144446/g.262302  ORF Transcript_144446/g.262302 Transcript_144446/m.262302 type:complete len:211 (-) Transcript_144446:140-772(-)